MGFHRNIITRGIYGELSKVREELEEAEDAIQQGQTLMLLVELADIVGACAGVAAKHGLSINDLVAFAQLRSKVAMEEEASTLHASTRTRNGKSRALEYFDHCLNERWREQHTAVSAPDARQDNGAADGPDALLEEQEQEDVYRHIKLSNLSQTVLGPVIPRREI
jgi:phosphoribosyl-ATP pyrophosphohydrolase